MTWKRHIEQKRMSECATATNDKNRRDSLIPLSCALHSGHTSKVMWQWHWIEKCCFLCSFSCLFCCIFCRSSVAVYWLAHKVFNFLKFHWFFLMEHTGNILLVRNNPMNSKNPNYAQKSTAQRDGSNSFLFNPCLMFLLLLLLQMMIAMMMMMMVLCWC